MAINIVILAAGAGKRMQSDTPKVLHALAGRPLLAHVLATARALSPARICVIYGFGGEQVPAACAAQDLTFVKQEPQRGTGDAVKKALPHLDTSHATLVLYGDVPLVSSASLAALVQGHNDRLKLLTVDLPDPEGYGRIVRDKENNVVAIVEEADATPEQRQIREINTGIMLIPGAHLTAWLNQLSSGNAQGEYYLTDVVALAVKQGVKIDTAVPAQTWEIMGVNSKKQLAELERIYQSQFASRLLDEGVALADPQRIDIRGELRCERDVRIDVNCVFEGVVEIGAGAAIGANCVIKNAKIGPATQIMPFSMIDDAVIGKGCQIGPYARIRPGTSLAEDVHIGNFVEIKASSIASGSKANHLSYIGDSSVGRNVNVGAGTITCNYDGAHKHRTVIEDDVFIGSDSQLVAPVTVRKGATIGAGSTITQEVPTGDLTLARARQVSISGWQRPQKNQDKE